MIRAGGVPIIAQARVVLQQVWRIGEIVLESEGRLDGELMLAIIPTLAPYLLPLFLEGFLSRYPGVRLIVSELPTEVILDRLKKNLLDAGLLATPLGEPGITERRLFYEEYVVFVSSLPMISTSVTSGCSKKVIACARRSCVCVSSRKG